MAALDAASLQAALLLELKAVLIEIPAIYVAMFLQPCPPPPPNLRLLATCEADDDLGCR